MHHTGIDELLKHNRQKDIMLQRTSGGVHRDDLLFHLNEQAFKTIASQGQRKSLLFALKLAEMEILKEEKAYVNNVYPDCILLNMFLKMLPLHTSYYSRQNLLSSHLNGLCLLKMVTYGRFQ